MFSHPRDYTPVCTTELGRAARLSGEFSKRDVKMIALSVDCVEDHHGWVKVLPHILDHTSEPQYLKHYTSFYVKLAF